MVRVVEVNGYKIERGADLQHANLSGADLTYANLQEANLDRRPIGDRTPAANLSGADLWRANVVDLELERAILAGTRMPDGTIHD